MPMEGRNEQEWVNCGVEWAGETQAYPTQTVSGFAHTELTTVLTFGFSVLEPTVGLPTEKQSGSNVGIQWAAHC